MSEQRFYIDHGMIHDRLSGRHVTTDETMYIDDIAVAGQSDIVDCCRLLNELDHPCSKCEADKGAAKARKMMEGLIFNEIEDQEGK